MRCLTASVWHVLPSPIAPAGGGGRFAFQLLSPTVLLLFHVGYRFVVFSVQELVDVFVGGHCYYKTMDHNHAVLEAKVR